MLHSDAELRATLRISAPVLQPSLAVAAARTGQVHVLNWLWATIVDGPAAQSAPGNPRSLFVLEAAAQHGAETLAAVYPECAARYAEMRYAVREPHDFQNGRCPECFAKHGFSGHTPDVAMISAPDTNATDPDEEDADGSFTCEICSKLSQVPQVFTDAISDRSLKPEKLIIRDHCIVAAAVAQPTCAVWDAARAKNLIHLSAYSVMTAFRFAQSKAVFDAVYDWAQSDSASSTYMYEAAVFEYAAAGNLDMLNAALQSSFPIKHSAAGVAAGYGHFEAMKWCIANVGVKSMIARADIGLDHLCIQYARKEALRIGNEAMLTWLTETYPQIDNDACVYIARDTWCDNEGEEYGFPDFQESAQKFMALVRRDFFRDDDEWAWG